MRLSRRHVAQLVESDPPQLVLVDDVTGREIPIAARYAVTQLPAAVRLYRGDVKADDLAVLAFIPDRHNPAGFRLDTRPFSSGIVPTGGGVIELSYPAVVHLAAAIEYFRPALEAPRG
jgi:hypothetical protein